MKKVNLIKNLLYKVEMGTETANLADWIGDYIPATSPLEALELAQSYLVENGYTGDVTNIQKCTDLHLYSKKQIYTNDGGKYHGKLF